MTNRFNFDPSKAKKWTDSFFNDKSPIVKEKQANKIIEDFIDSVIDALIPPKPTENQVSQKEGNDYRFSYTKTNLDNKTIEFNFYIPGVKKEDISLYIKGNSIFLEYIQNGLTAVRDYVIFPNFIYDEDIVSVKNNYADGVLTVKINIDSVEKQERNHLLTID